MSNRDDLVEKAAVGDPAAARELFSAVYEDLKRVAAARLAGEAAGHSLSPTALVHESFLKIGPDFQANDATHLYRAAAKAMRLILVDAARRRKSQKRGGGWTRLPTEPDQIAEERFTIDPLHFHEALERLEQANPLAATVVDLRFHAGLTWARIAETMGVSVEKVDSLWRYARARLLCDLRESE